MELWRTPFPNTKELLLCTPGSCLDESTSAGLLNSLVGNFSKKVERTIFFEKTIQFIDVLVGRFFSVQDLVCSFSLPWRFSSDPLGCWVAWDSSFKAHRLWVLCFFFQVAFKSSHLEKDRYRYLCKEFSSSTFFFHFWGPGSSMSCDFLPIRWDHLWKRSLRHYRMSEEPQEIRQLGVRDLHISDMIHLLQLLFGIRFFLEKFLCNNVILKTKPFCGFLFC